MLDVLTGITDQARIEIPERNRRRIAIVGAGAIVDAAHLPAYRKHGLDVIGIHDVDSERARAVARRHDVPVVYDELEDLLQDERAEVVDIAVVPWAQAEIARKALAAGKHLLCQKPFAPDVATARELIALAEEGGRAVVVNQQLRFDEGLAAARAMVNARWIGQPTAITFDVDITTDWSAWGWLLEAPRLEIMYHSIHYLDAIRSIFGDPESVYASTATTPGQQPRAETRSVSILNYSDGRRAIVHVNHENRTPDARAEFRIDGAEGSIRGTLGLLYDYPHGRPDTLAVYSRTLPTDGWLPYPVTERWLPAAFAGPMATLLEEIESGRPASSRASDNVRTLSLVHALYESAESGQAQELLHP